MLWNTVRDVIVCSLVTAGVAAVLVVGHFALMGKDVRR